MVYKCNHCTHVLEGRYQGTVYHTTPEGEKLPLRTWIPDLTKCCKCMKMEGVRERQQEIVKGWNK